MAGFRPVGAEEKYAELEARGEDRPLCKCHKKTMRWKKRGKYSAGGNWECAPRAATNSKKYRTSHPMHDRERSRHWRENSPEKVLQYNLKNPSTVRVRNYQNRQDLARIQTILESFPELRGVLNV